MNDPGRIDRWERRTRLWWLALVAFCLCCFLALRTRGAYSVALLITAGLIAFDAGYFYNERLRRLGRQSRISGLRHPDA